VFHACGELVDATTGAVLATSTGKYLPVPEDQVGWMKADFVGGPPVF
jgi:hypothetical protein